MKEEILLLPVALVALVSSQTCSLRSIVEVECSGRPDLFYDAANNNLNKFCGRRQNANIGYVVGGRGADPGEVPWLGSLIYDGIHKCGAVVLDERHILTAAHCIIQEFPFDDRGVKEEELTVKLGSRIRHKLGRNDPEALFAEVSRIFVYPTYRQKYYSEYGPEAGGDLAVLRLTASIDFSCLLYTSPRPRDS